MAAHIAVLGAGVIGCSVAVNIAELCRDKNVTVTLISDKFTPHTTSDRSGASILPMELTNDKNAQAERIMKWSKQTIKYLDSLFIAKDNVVSDINLQYVYGYYALSDYPKDPWWACLTPGFHHITTEERRTMNIPDQFPTVYAFNMYMLSCRCYLPWLMERFAKAGGITEQRKVDSLDELSSYDLVINCTSLGSATLVNDKELYPVKGDVVLVEAPWVKQFLYLFTPDSCTYIFPRRDDVVLGGTFKYNDWSEGTDEESSSDILRRACEGIPSLANARIKETWSALRPVREKIRVEVDSDNSDLIHCYGLGGQGILLHWGCALEVTDMVCQWFMHRNKTLQNKL